MGRDHTSRERNSGENYRNATIWHILTHNTQAQSIKSCCGGRGGVVYNLSFVMGILARDDGRVEDASFA